MALYTNQSGNLKEVKENPFKLEKDILLQDIRSERDTPRQVCQLNFAKALYGTHPYGRSGLGTEETVRELTTQDLRDFYRSYIHQGAVVISSVGNFDKTLWETEMAELIHQLPQTGKMASPATPVLTKKDLTLVVEKKQPLQQSHLLIGFVGPNLHN